MRGQAATLVRASPVKSARAVGGVGLHDPIVKSFGRLADGDRVGF